MGLISRVSSRTYSFQKKKFNNMELLCPGSYFNSGDLEARNEHVTVKFKREISSQLLQLLQNNADLDENTNQKLLNSPNIPEGTQVEIPFRFAEILLRKEMIEILCPKSYKRQTREILLAGASALNLPQHQSHFYELAIHLSTVTDDEGVPIGLGGSEEKNLEQKKAVESACLAFQDRACVLLDGNGVKDEANLDLLELEILKSAKASKERWEDCEKGRSLSGVSVLTQARKRKANE